MMRLLFLGTGSAFTLGMDNFQSNMLFISDNNQTLLIDCGTDVRFSLDKQHKTYRDIQAVYISHLHADHAGGLEWLALSSKFDPRVELKPTLYISETLEKELWDKTLSGGLSTLQDEEASLAAYFEVHAIPLNGTFQWENCDFHTVQTVHASNRYSLMQSFGLLCTIGQKKVFISTDTQFYPFLLMPFYETADLIFHDCELLSTPTGVHAHYEQLKTLPPEIKAKMWLYHYNPGPLPNAKKAGFLGFVTCGQQFIF